MLFPTHNVPVFSAWSCSRAVTTRQRALRVTGHSRWPATDHCGLGGEERKPSSAKQPRTLLCLDHKRVNITMATKTLPSTPINNAHQLTRHTGVIPKSTRPKSTGYRTTHRSSSQAKHQSSLLASRQENENILAVSLVCGEYDKNKCRIGFRSDKSSVSVPSTRSLGP